MELLAAALCSASLAVAALPFATPSLTAAAVELPRTADGAPTLTLDEAVTEARKAAPVEAARLRAEAAARVSGLAGRLPDPSVELRTENWQPGGRAAGDPLLDTFVVVSQPVELGAKGAARRRLADADARWRESEWLGVERHLAREIAESYVSALRARERRALIREQRESTREVVTTLERRLAEGVAPEADLRKVEADLARLDVDALRAELELQRQLGWLSALLGRHTPVEADSLAIPPLGVTPVAAGGDEAWVEAHPDVARARQQAHVAAAGAELARRQRWPDLVVSGGYKRTAGVDTAVAGVSVTLPVYGGQSRAVALSEAERAAADLLVADAQRRVRAHAIAQLTAANRLRERAAEVERDVLAPAEIARRAERSSFREGAGDVLRLLDAERVYGDARREARELMLDAVLAAVHARLAIGDDRP